MSARDLARAQQMIGRGEYAPAARLLRAVVSADPANALAQTDLAQALWRDGKPAEAVPFAARAAELIPNSPSFHLLHGFCLALAKRLPEGIAAMERALALDPASPDAVVPLVEAYATEMRFHDAAKLARAAVDRFPAEPRFCSSLASALINLGDEAGTDAALELAARRCPADLTCASMRAFVTHYRDAFDRTEQLARHRRVGELISMGLDPLPPVVIDEHPDRTLRIGLVSPDLRSHSVAYFARPLIENLGPGFKVHVFFTSRDPDDATLRFRAFVTRAGGAWHDAARLEHLAITQLIRTQKIDVLIDLSGLTNNHRLPVFALKPAPVQVTAIGYPGTTGLRTFDARITDTLADPPGEERWHTEPLLRLDPCFLCYTPIDEAPPPAPGPLERGGPVTFGSFNAVSKFSDRVLALWARVLNAVPGSRLVLKVGGSSKPGAAAPLLSRLQRAGIDPARVTLLERTTTQSEHLALYSEMDIALDTFPYHGTTTTCEALLMGVPVISRAGDRHASRVGLSLLTAAGRPQWAVLSDDDFVARAVELAQDPARLASLRRELRPALLASPLCDAPAYGRRFAAALRGLWKNRRSLPRG